MHNAFLAGDSADEGERNKLHLFCEQLQAIGATSKPFLRVRIRVFVEKGKRLGDHIILEDPAGNSYLQVYYI